MVKAAATRATVAGRGSCPRRLDAFPTELFGDMCEEGNALLYRCWDRCARLLREREHMRAMLANGQVDAIDQYIVAIEKGPL